MATCASRASDARGLESCCADMSTGLSILALIFLRLGDCAFSGSSNSGLTGCRSPFCVLFIIWCNRGRKGVVNAMKGKNSKNT